MPKKTKKQKLLADLHRKLGTFETDKTQFSYKNTKFVKSQNEVGLSTSQPLTLPQIAYRKQVVAKPKNPISASSYSYVKHDLVRITIFTLFALLLQVVLYFLLRTR